MPPKPLKVPNPLAHLTSKHLQTLTALCGLATTGSKPTLTSQLRAAALSPPTLTPTSRILSIDLGLRNLAFALLSPNLTLHAWTRLDLLPPENQDQDFSPPSIAQLAVALLDTHLLPLAPTHILIERQRFRSGGAAPVLEWTLRVNALETALYAALATLRQRGLWTGREVCVPPRRASQFLVGDGMGERVPWEGGEGGKVLLRGDPGEVEGEVVGKGSKALKVAKANKALKVAKIRLVEASLREGKVVKLGTDEAREAVARFFEAGERKKAGRKAKEEKAAEADESKKRDDLADCLCQGVAWLQWQKNLEGLKKTEPWILERE